MKVCCYLLQEEFIAGDEVGRIGCNHGYHAVCINQWLRLKNWCPVCKASAKAWNSLVNMPTSFVQNRLFRAFCTYISGFKRVINLGFLALCWNSILDTLELQWKSTTIFHGFLFVGFLPFLSLSLLMHKANNFNVLFSVKCKK